MRKPATWAVLGILLILGGAAFAQGGIITCDASGDINSVTSEAMLQKRFGERVERAQVEVGEGETQPGTVLKAANGGRPELYFTWKDAAHTHLASIRTSGPSKWRLAGGIKIGTSLQTLQKLNGKPFTLAGFEWDYAGTVLSWNGGKLARLNARRCKVILRLDAHSGEKSISAEQQALVSELL